MSETIKFEFVETNFLTRWRCHVCGGCTEKDPVLCEAPHPDGALRVCDQCLKAGNINERLEATANRYEAMAAETRSLIGRLIVPSYAEWTARIAEHEEQWVRENTNCKSVAEYEARIRSPFPDDEFTPF